MLLRLRGSRNIEVVIHFPIGNLLSVQHRLSEMHIITENFSNAFSRSTSPVPNLPEYNLTHGDLLQFSRIYLQHKKNIYLHGHMKSYTQMPVIPFTSPTDVSLDSPSGNPLLKLAHDVVSILTPVWLHYSPGYKNILNQLLSLLFKLHPRNFEECIVFLPRTKIINLIKFLLGLPKKESKKKFWVHYNMNNLFFKKEGSLEANCDIIKIENENINIIDWKLMKKTKISNTKKLIENLEFYTLEYEETL
ncbi:hypothetical protein H8356DRAFT_1416535 [Neocallimastix lanati (nom. inval.)]|nr:hypothetical protein H8356DRAFT_1416535 [Neocallimastix sp. JGI-2020a]